MELLESEKYEPEQLEQFKYFWLFFRRDAFVKDAYGKTFLDRVREGSTTYVTEVEAELKKLVFERVFPDLAGGFVAAAHRRGETPGPRAVYEATLSFLYKILFLLYAEGKNLLPSQLEAYREYSLIGMTQEIATRIDRAATFSQAATGWYDKLLSLFHIVDRGDAAVTGSPVQRRLVSSGVGDKWRNGVERKRISATDAATDFENAGGAV